MKILQLKKLYAFIMMIMLSSFPALHAQQVNDFFNRRFHKRIPHSMIKSDAYNVQDNSMQRRKNPACIEWQKTIGGSGEEDRGAIKVIPGGYITCGSTNSPDGDFRVPADHDFDAYVVKLNNKGNIVWVSTYGGTGYDDFNDIIPTGDGGFIAIGASTSNDGDLTGNHGDEDVWVVKLDANGKIKWQKNYGGIMEDHGNTILETGNGYVFSAGAASSDGDVTFSHGDLDAWIVKISLSGKILFQQTYGGSGYEDPDGLYFNPSDGTIIFSSETESSDNDVNGAHGGTDAWVVKIDKPGNIIWKRTLGGSLDDNFDELARTSDGNIVIASTSHSFDGDVAGNNGLIVMWLIKLNAANGHTIWNKTFANPAELGAFGVLATADGGAVALGATGSSLDFATFDALVLKVDAKGNQEWIKIFGGSSQDFSAFGTISANGNIITSNYTESNDGDVKKADGGADIWIVAFDKCGNFVDKGTTEQKNIKPDFINTLSSYPNPFSNSTTISFTLSKPQKVSLKIYDVNGRLVKILTDQNFETGMHKIEWNTDAALSPGIYFLNMQTATFSKIQKLMISK